MGSQPVRICANCGVGVAAQSSYRRSFPLLTAAGKHFVVVGHLCHGCRARFRNDDEAGTFLESELEGSLIRPK